MRILRACFTFGKITHGISPFKVWNLDSVAPIFVVVGSIVGPHQTSNLCNMTQPTNIRDAKKAFNQALYRPTAERKAEAVKLLQALITQVNEMEETKTKPKAKRVKRKSTAQKLEEAQARDNVSETYLPADKPKRKPKAQPKQESVPFDVVALPEFSDLVDDGYSVEDAVRYVQMLAMGAPEPMEA